MEALIRAREAISTAAGGALAGAARAVDAVRPPAKPLHPRGVVRAGRLRRGPSAERVGVPLIDEAGDDPVTVRLSRAVGLPRSLPDIQGLALRVPGPDGRPGDLLFATTGWGTLTRYVLTPARSVGGRPMTTLLPYSTSTGPVVLGARFAGEHRVELAWARPRGSFVSFADLELEGGPEGGSEEDADIRFDPVRHQVPGLRVPSWVVRLREPAYAVARRDDAS
jgi:hypothetical protein